MHTYHITFKIHRALITSQRP